MKVNWKKKISISLYCLGWGPIMLFFDYDKTWWDDGIIWGLFFCSLKFAGIAALVFIFYWPLLKKSHVSKEIGGKLRCPVLY